MQEDRYIFRNELLRQHIILGMIVSIIFAIIFFIIGEFTLFSIGIALNISLVTLFFLTRQNANFIANSRNFMFLVSLAFIFGFVYSSQDVFTSSLIILYPVASFTIRGPKEGIMWSSMLMFILISIYIYDQSRYNLVSFASFAITYVMVAHSLFIYRHYELKNFEQINKELETIVSQRTKELQEKNEQLQKISVTDKLTGLFNRLKLDEVLEFEINRSDRFNHSFGIIILDIDDFKSVNDTYGHQMGDYILKTMASIIEHNIRKTDVVGRWGGEEFMVICPENSKEETVLVAEKIRKSLESYTYETVGSKTASLGVSIYTKDMGINNLISKADEALYRSKKSGKNQVSVNL